MTLLLMLATAATLSPAPRNGEELIRAMHDRYAGKWYRTLTFVQKTGLPDGSVQTWYEAAQFPGLLRIDIAPLDSGQAIIFRNDTIYQLHGGKVQTAAPLVHPLMVLGFDVYADAVESTVVKLRKLAFDMTKLRTDIWQGKPVYVVGADSGDAHSAQFWIDQKDLLFVRMLRPTATGGTSEVQFNKYVKLRDGWLAPEVLFFVNGKPGQTEEYSQWKTGMTFEPHLFDPSTFARAGWIK
jgi:hypothetical protein